MSMLPSGFLIGRGNSTEIAAAAFIPLPTGYESYATAHPKREFAIRVVPRAGLGDARARHSPGL